MTQISESYLDQLRETVMHAMSPKRFRHTVAVEEMAARLCDLFCPEQTQKMRLGPLILSICQKEHFSESVCGIAHYP